MRKFLLVSAAMLGIAAGSAHATGVVPSARVATGGGATTNATVDWNVGITQGQSNMPSRTKTACPAAPNDQTMQQS